MNIMWLFLLFIAVPIVEIALFIKIGGFLGLWLTISIIILTAVIGTVLVKQQGLAVIQQIRDKVLRGNQYGAYFIYPKPNSDFNSIGVVTATGIKGMHAAYANDYLENGTFYPDVIIFDEKMPKQGLSGVKFTGFFGNDWSIENGKFIWNQ